jgi:predicted lactoylglutathione lyase
MATNIFVNLPVKDLERSKAFFQKLGYAFNPQFTDDNAGCLVLGPNLFAMLLTSKFFETFTTKPTADASKVTEVLVALGEESKADVDRICDAALASGGSKHKDPQDMGFMYSRSFQDPDGHVWEYAWMNPEHVQK